MNPLAQVLVRSVDLLRSSFGQRPVPTFHCSVSSRLQIKAAGLLLQPGQHHFTHTEEVDTLCNAKEGSDDQRSARRPLEERCRTLALQDASGEGKGERVIVLVTEHAGE